MHLTLRVHSKIDKELGTVLDNIDRQLQSQFDEDFMEPCSQHSDVGVEEVYNSFIAHIIQVDDGKDFNSR